MAGSQVVDTIYLYDGEDRSKAVLALFIGTRNVLNPSNESAVLDGWVCFKAKSGELIRMRFSDIEVFLRRFN